MAPLPVATAMRYGAPSLRQGLHRLLSLGAERIIVLGLYPQYAESTLGTLDAALPAAFKAALGKRGGSNGAPRLERIPSWEAEPGYIACLAEQVRQACSRAEGGPPEALLVSFHGLPEKAVEKGDPYRDHARATFAALERALAPAPFAIELVYQSRFGPAPWLRPYAAERIPALARAGLRRLMVIHPGFSVDCLETLEESDGQLRELFLEAGGASYCRIPCLNASAAHADFLADLVRRQLAQPAAVPS